jgi:hypothetical protein
MRHYYRRPEWIEFRADILERDGWRCHRCGRGATDRATLQVHHEEYLVGRLPWEYPPRLCVTLCKGCLAVEHGKIFPWSDWDLVSDNDLGDLSGECDLCGTELRYEFLIEHPKWFPMIVGTHCCDTLTGSDAASQIRREKERLTRFIASKRWQFSPHGIKIRRSKMDFEIAIDEKGYFIQILKKNGKKRFPTIEQAKAAVFELIETGKAAEYFEKNKLK